MLKEEFFNSRYSSLLYPLSLFYKWLIKVRLFMYEKGFLKKIKLPGFVISVGNITVGGTGKTPFVMEIARWARDKGYRTGIISRGYKGSYKEWMLVSDGKELKASVREVGDEPYLMAKKLKGVVVAVSRKRYIAGINIAKRYGIDFFILDDGFQHIALKRDIDVLLIGEKGFGNKRLFPSGPLREPLDQIKRADIFLIPKEKSFDIKKNVFFYKYVPDSFIMPSKNLRLSLEYLKGKKAVAFAGIAYPERFKKMLDQIGVKLVFFKCFPDHHWYKKDEIERLLEYAKKRADLLITTEKDWVRVMDKNIGYIEIRFEIENRQALFRIIDEKYKKNTHKSN